MNPDANHELLVGQMWNDEVLHHVEDVQRECRYLAGVADAVEARTPTGNHVGISDSFHLINVVQVDPAIERRVQLVEERHDLFIQQNTND